MRRRVTGAAARLAVLIGGLLMVGCGGGRRPDASPTQIVGSWLAALGGSFRFAADSSFVAQDVLAGGFGKTYPDDHGSLSGHVGRGNSTSLRSRSTANIKPTWRAAIRADIAAGYATQTDVEAKLPGALESTATNGYENSPNPRAVATHYSWDW
jgi:hypothetical protein